MNPDYSIIIPAYNEEVLLPATLESIIEAMESVPTHSGEVVVADNDSTDLTATVARGYGATVVFEGHRQIARARNAGAEAGRGRYLIFVDADTCISGSLLQKTICLLDSGHICGGGAMIAPDRKVAVGNQLAISTWNAVSKLCRWAAGSYVYCLREAFTDVGGFDDEYYAAEEIRFSRSLKQWGRKHGQRIKIIDEAVITSMRKLDWFSTFYIFKTALAFALNPVRLRRKESCRLWYQRPS